MGDANLNLYSLGVCKSLVFVSGRKSGTNRRYGYVSVREGFQKGKEKSYSSSFLPPKPTRPSLSSAPSCYCTVEAGERPHKRFRFRVQCCSIQRSKDPRKRRRRVTTGGGRVALKMERNTKVVSLGRARSPALPSGGRARTEALPFTAPTSVKAKAKALILLVITTAVRSRPTAVAPEIGNCPVLSWLSLLSANCSALVLPGRGRPAEWGNLLLKIKSVGFVVSPAEVRLG